MNIRPIEPAEFALAEALYAHPDVAPYLHGHSFVGSAAARAALADKLLVGAFEGGRLRACAVLASHTRPRRKHCANLDLFCTRQEMSAASALASWAVEKGWRWLQLAKISAGVDEDAPWLEALTSAGLTIDARLRRRRWRDGAPRDELLLGWVRPGAERSSAAFAPFAPARGERRAVHIRAATPDDAPALAALHRTESVMRGTFQTPIRTIAWWRRRIDGGRTDVISLVAEIDQAVVGSGTLIRRAAPAHGTHMIGLTVAPAHQGCGVGGALMARLVRLGREELGARRIELGVDRDNGAAKALYEKLGFVDEGVERAAGWRGDGYADAHCMALLSD